MGCRAQALRQGDSLSVHGGCRTYYRSPSSSSSNQIPINPTLPFTLHPGGCPHLLPLRFQQPIADDLHAEQESGACEEGVETTGEQGGGAGEEGEDKPATCRAGKRSG